MQFDPNNKVVQLCIEGMDMEAKGKFDEARTVFLHAWSEANTDFEKFTAAHYVARHQKSVEEKLKWDKTALEFALKIDDTNMTVNYPSLYLNIAKCYEDLDDIDNAQQYYETASSYSNCIPDNSYGQMIRSGINKGLERIAGL